VEAQLCRIFERQLRVLLVNTGTAANSLALAAMAPPWGSVLCHRLAHIDVDECGAPAFFGAGLTLVASASSGSKLDPAVLADELRRGKGDVHSVQPSAVSITQATEQGQVYTPDEIGAIAAACRATQVPLHMDGARFANALTAAGCTPAELTWQAGVDMLSFGATKNGALNAEALLVFNDSLWETLPFRRKRAGHLLSKMRFVSAQMQAYREAGRRNMVWAMGRQDDDGWFHDNAFHPSETPLTHTIAYAIQGLLEGGFLLADEPMLASATRACRRRAPATICLCCCWPPWDWWGFWWWRAACAPRRVSLIHDVRGSTGGVLSVDPFLFCA